MTPFVWVVLVVVAAAILAGTPALIRALSDSGVVDVPNERSSHARPVPRGAGLVLVVSLPLAGLAYFLAGDIRAPQLTIVAVAALLVGGIGFYDDRRGAGVRLRLLVHCVAAALVVAAVWADEPGATGIAFEWTQLFWVAALVWGLNLYNFMDGIDGIALQQAIFLSAGGVLLLSGTGSMWQPVLLTILIGSSVLLIWNWSPARVFLGDAGSGFLGFLLAAIAVHCVAQGHTSLVAWMILWGVFFVDSAVTLIRRMLRGERWYEAHRCHAYQRLASRLGSHAITTLLLAAVNVFWLLPWAYLAQIRYLPATVCAVVALLPLLVAALTIGAGSSSDGD